MSHSSRKSLWNVLAASLLVAGVASADEPQTKSKADPAPARLAVSVARSGGPAIPYALIRKPVVELRLVSQDRAVRDKQGCSQHVPEGLSLSKEHGHVTLVAKIPLERAGCIPACRGRRER